MTLSNSERETQIRIQVQRMAQAKTLAGNQQCWQFRGLLMRGRVEQVQGSAVSGE